MKILAHNIIFKNSYIILYLILILICLVSPILVSINVLSESSTQSISCIGDFYSFNINTIHDSINNSINNSANKSTSDSSTGVQVFIVIFLIQIVLATLPIILLCPNASCADMPELLDIESRPFISVISNISDNV